jgi:hypothetical protein
VTGVHLLLPAGFDDPLRPSGGNQYDRAVVEGLTGLGWRVAVHAVEDAWPVPSPGVAAAVDRELAQVPADRVVVVDGLLATVAAAALLRHSTRLRLVPLVHMPDPPGGPPAEVLGAARLVVTTSQWSADVLAETRCPPTVELLVAPPGASAAGLATGTPIGGSLLCVAAVTPAKGHDVLFAALAALAAPAAPAAPVEVSDVPPWTCVCVGALDRDPGFVERQRQVLADRGIADRVRLAGPMDRPDLQRAYAAADLLVLPTRLESYGMVVTEALARGLPVVATAVGGVPEALGRDAGGRRPGLLVPPDDAPALAGALASWLTEPHLRDDLRTAARSRRAMLGGWDRTVATLAAGLSRVAAR